MILAEKLKGLDAHLVLWVHDEVEVDCEASIAPVVAKHMEDSLREAGELLNLNCPIAGEAHIGNNWSEVH